MSDRLTAEPGTLEYLRQLYEIACRSEHPMDKALVGVLSKQIEEAEGRFLRVRLIKSLRLLFRRLWLYLKWGPFWPIRWQLTRWRISREVEKEFGDGT